MSWKNDQVSEMETEKILRFARECLDVPGDYVEFGCYKGDTSLLIAEVLREYNSGEIVENYAKKGVESLGKSGEKGVENRSGGKDKKKLWIYDSFEGLPAKMEVDKSVLGEAFKGGELAVTKREVKERFLRAGLPVPVIKKGWFADLTEADLPERIAFAFLDGDFYESIRDSLKLVVPRMVEGGVLIVHDYSSPALPGVKKAVEEWGEVGGVGFRVVLL